MPKEWYDRGANRYYEGMTDAERDVVDFNLRIIADKKPYFMRYIYPTLAAEYNTYIKNTRKKCIREFRKDIDELLACDPAELTDAERDFLKYYEQRMPVGMHRCVMNRICMMFEDEFDNYFLKNVQDDAFDYTVMQSGQEYTTSQYNAVEKIYEQYSRRVRDYMQVCRSERIDDDEAAAHRSMMVREFRAECDSVCSNGSLLCDIILDMCYKKSGTKQFCWDMCADEILENLLRKHGGVIRYPIRDEDGAIEFLGERFRIDEREIAYGEYSS